MTKPNTPARVLFICDGNADNAQMAEGLLKARVGERFDIYSAGINPQPISPLAIRVMSDIGIDIADHPVRDINDYLSLQFDHVITICAHADHSCLNFPRDGHVIHWQLEDPSKAIGDVDEKLEVYRQARDALAARVEAWLMIQ
jgi:arsenate reductase